jgi:hypothetical protein
MMRSSKLRASLVLLLAAAAPAVLAGDVSPVSHCTQAEEIVFSCHIRTKLVSLCAAKESGAVRTLAYRYGLPGHVENEFLASQDNGNRFLASVAPATPRARVSQVWFLRGDVKYLLTQCEGGDCPHAAGLTVFSGARIISNTACSREPTDAPWFSTRSQVVDFDSSVADSKSHTTLLKLVEADNSIETIYGVPAGAPGVN